MIIFLLKGILRDHHRSLFPLIVVSFGVFLTTVLYSYINGEIDDLIDANARYDTGHVKVTTKAFSESQNKSSNEFSLIDVNNLALILTKRYNDYEWIPRIRFIGLIDVPDQVGETKSQSTIFGLAIILEDKNEITRLKLNEAIVSGRLPKKEREILIGNELAKTIGLEIGQAFTLLSSTANGAMAVENFTVCGKIEFGIAGMDRGIIIASLRDIQFTLEMENGASEILGFSKSKFYNSDETGEMRDDFNKKFTNEENEFSSIMMTLGDQNGLSEWLNYVHVIGLLIVGIFLIAMSIVLLNTGLMSGIRRYGEIGVRLALGEAKGKIYSAMLYESFAIGLVGSAIGMIFGLAAAYYLQEIGIDITGTLRNSSIMMPNILRAKVNFTSMYIGFIPGLLATIIGTALSGIQIYKRQTASLFKELEV